MPQSRSLSDQLRGLLALTASAGMFCTVGWMTMRPTDPLGPIALVGHPHPAQMLLVGLLLTVVTASVAELLGGGRLPHIGLFASAFGLVVLSLQGGDMRDLLLATLQHAGVSRQALYFSLAAEAGVWAMVLAAGYVTSAWLRRWLSTNGRSGLPGAIESSTIQKPVDGVRASRDRDSASSPSAARELVQGLLAWVTVGALAMLIIRTAAAESPVGAIRTGQVFFSIGAGFWLATWVSAQVFPAARLGWMVAAVPAVAVVGCLMAATSEGFTGGWLQSYNDVTTVPANAYTRALPIEHVAVGVLGVLMGLRGTGSDSVSSMKTGS